MDLPKKIDRFELGYQPLAEEALKTNQGQTRTIQETFYNVRFNYEDQVAIIEEVVEEIPNLVHYFPLDDTLNN